MTTKRLTENDPRRRYREWTRRHRTLEHIDVNGPSTTAALMKAIVPEITDEFLARTRMTQTMQNASNVQLVTREGPVWAHDTVWSLTKLGRLYLERARAGKFVGPEFLLVEANNGQLHPSFGR
jgi:hypothetical protein